MNKILLDTSKISIYAQIQKNLCELECNSEDEAINTLIDQIPQNFLCQKEDLMIICQLFAYYARICKPSTKRNSIKLFERILNQIKLYLQDESSFFWTIFGSLFYFKLWMYDEGLISIEQIILAAQEDQSTLVIDYFLPEIIKERPELFDKELKFKYKKTFSEESIQQFKEIRKKHFQWLRDSADYNDQLYTEIEQNRLRLSIKRDDIESFQKILSESNISVNSKVMESSLENFLRFPAEISLLEYAIEFDSIQIVKFLIMNDAVFNVDMIYFAIQRNNYDLIHLLESKFKEKFGIESLPDSITLWNNEMTEYALNNYDFNFLFEKDINPKSDQALRTVIQSIISINFVFIESTILPFLDNNPEFLKHNIYEIVLSTFSEKSCFFLKAFIEFPGIDVNHHFTNYNITFAYKALEESNVKGLEILLSRPNIDVNCTAYQRFSPIQIACKIYSDMKIIKMLCNHPKIDVNKTDAAIQTNAFQLAVCCGHFYAAQYFIDRYPDLEKRNFFYLLFFLCLCYHHLYSLKIIVKYFMEKTKNINGEQLINNFKKYFSSQIDYKDEFENELRLILCELNGNL